MRWDVDVSLTVAAGLPLSVPPVLVVEIAGAGDTGGRAHCLSTRAPRTHENDAKQQGAQRHPWTTQPALEQKPVQHSCADNF